MDDFDELDYQGRSKKRVENNYKVAYISFYILITLLAATVLAVLIDFVLR